jgi:hypothetical protein
MNIALFVIGIVLFGLLSLISLVFTIIYLANGKSSGAAGWGGGFVASLIGLIVCIYFTVHTVSEKIKSGIDWAQQNTGTYGSAPAGPDIDYKQPDRQNFLDTLKAYTNDMHEGKVPDTFYENRAADSAKDGSIIVPFLYPYSIKYNSANFIGDIIIAESGKVYASNISQMAFDKNFVIAKVDNSTSQEMLKAGKPEIEYILFDMRTGEFESFPNLQKLLEISGKIGYTGPDLMNYLSDNYTGWIEYAEYD